MRIKITFILILFVAKSIAQNYKFGKVSKKELEEQFYPLDSTADAAYLHKSRKTYYEHRGGSNFVIVSEYHERIKVYTKKGLAMATQQIFHHTPYNGSAVKINSIKAYTYNIENGKVNKTRLSKSSIFRDKLNKYYSVVKISMPDVKSGSIIELSYTRISPYIHYIEDVEFQFGIPVKNLEVSIELPEYFVYNKLSKGFYSVIPEIAYKQNTLNNGVGYKYEISKYKAKNIPALKNDEPYVSNIDNYRGGVKFEISSINFMAFGGGIKNYALTWENVSKQIFKSSDFGDDLKRSNYFEEDLNRLLANLKDDNQRVDSIFKFVKSKVKWNEKYGKYPENGVRKAYEEGVGNVADINLMLTAMLRKAGLNANPVLLSTKNNGIPLFPTLNGFNYVISMVEFTNGTHVLLDATEPYSLPNVLPTRDLNWKGRKVTKEGKSSWVSLKPNNPSIVKSNVSVKITDDLTVEGTARFTYENFAAVNYRINKNATSNSGSFDEVEISDYKVLNQYKIDKPICIMYKFIGEDLVEEISGKIYLKPLLYLALKTNPFRLEERKYPIDFSRPFQTINHVGIQIPDGYKVVSIPQKMAIALPEKLGVFKYQVLQKGNMITAISVLEINNAIIGYQMYPIFKKFYGDMVAKQLEQIVLVKQ